MQIHADLRLIESRVFKSRYSLRFPRIERLRYDKGPDNIVTEEEVDTHREKRAKGARIHFARISAKIWCLSVCVQSCC